MFSSTTMGKDFSSKDSSDLLKNKNWYIFNGSMELGVPEKPAPGFSMMGYFEPKMAAKNINKNYFPMTREEADGNKYLLVQGYKGLPEYNVYCNKFFLQTSGEVEVSFRAKITADESGKFQEKRPIILDFRCRDKNRLYGTVKQRYPVLKSKTLRPTEEWQFYKYKIKVLAGFEYKIMFRQYASKVYDNLNGFCLDDLSIKYTEQKPVKGKTELAIIPDRLISAYYKDDKAVFKVNATIPDGKNNEKIRLYVREDYSNRIFDTIDLILKKVSSSKKLYTGSFKLKNKRYGSYNILCERNGKFIFSMGGDFVTLHKLPSQASPLQRKIGGHFRPGGYFQFLSYYNVAAVRTNLGLNSEAKVYALSGLRHAMYSFDMKKVQAKIDQLDFTMTDAEIALLEKHNIEVIGCLGGWWIRQRQKTYKGRKYGPQLPDWFFDKKFTKARPPSIKRGKPVQVPSIEVWKFHVDGIVERYGKRIKKWMTLVEPQWVLLPEEYLAFQKVAYEKTKAVNPNSFFIGGDATSDVGYNLTGWLEKLSKLGFEKYLDAASFNPYRSSCDYINGIRFRYSNLTKRIRKSIKKDTPIWEEELYYITNSKRKQDPGAQDIFSAGDAQRHYLLGFINGLRGITAISNFGSALYKNPYTPSDVCAGINAMSYFLSGKSEFESVSANNKLIRAGLFYNKTKTNCAAVIWALQPKGSSVLLASTAGIKSFDNFGNEIKTQKNMPLKLDPVFLVGKYETLKNIIKNSKYAMGIPIKLRSRSFGSGKTFYEAQNLSGKNNIILLDMGKNMPEIRLKFNNYDYQRFSIPAAAKKYKVGLQGEVIENEQTVEHITDNGNLIIPRNAVNPLKFNSRSGNIINVWTENGKLWIKAEINDNKVTPSPNDALYNGDALELFIDRTPFFRMDIDEITKASNELKVSQYVFAAVPSKSGKNIMALDKSKNINISNSKAVSASSKTPKGYTITASIPLAEIIPMAGNNNIIGINFELCRRDGGKILPKDCFSDSKRPSYKYRLHYKLAELKGINVNILKNGDCEDGLKNWSCYQDYLLKTKNMFVTSDAFAGKKAIKVLIEEKPSWGPTLKRGILSYRTKLDAGNYILSFYAKAEKADHFKISLSNANVISFKKNSVPVSRYWTKYQVALTVKKKAENGKLGFQFISHRKDKDAYFIIDEVQLTKQ